LLLPLAFAVHCPSTSHDELQLAPCAQMQVPDPVGQDGAASADDDSMFASVAPSLSANVALPSSAPPASGVPPANNASKSSAQEAAAMVTRRAAEVIARRSNIVFESSVCWYA
jgi:hypothetical protein